jgi:hypothetical protein
LPASAAEPHGYLSYNPLLAFKERLLDGSMVIPAVRLPG